MAKRVGSAPSETAKIYQPTTSAKGFHDSLAQVKAICGPAGSGKSLAAIMEFVLMAIESPVPVRGIVLRETFRQLNDSTRQTWTEWLASVSRYQTDGHNMYLRLTGADGIEREHLMMFRHARRVEEASNFLSTELAFIWLEEVVPAFQMESGVIGGGLPKGMFDVALMRQRQAGVHRLHIVLTFNPPSRFHWTYKTFFAPTATELEAQDFALFRQPAYENEKHLPVNYYQRLKEQLDEDMFRRFVLGEVVTLYPGVRVFPQFHEGIHLVDDIEAVPGCPLVIGFDFGLTPVAIIGQQLPSGRVIELREVQLWNSGVKRLAEHLGAVIKTDFAGISQHVHCWGDPAGVSRAQTDERTCFEILDEHGFHVEPGPIDFQSRKEIVIQRASMLGDDGKPALLISQRGCPMLSEGLLGGYRYLRYSSGDVSALPVKNDYSHVCDALQYQLGGLYDVRGALRDARGGDFAQKPKPYHPLLTKTGGGAYGRSWMSQ